MYLGNVTPFEAKGVTVQFTNSDITQTLNRHAYFVTRKCKRMCDCTQVTRLSKTCGVAKYSIDICRDMPEKKNKRYSLACVYTLD